MKKIYSYLFLFLLSCTTLLADKGSSVITLYTQSDIDDFAINYPNMVKTPSDLLIINIGEAITNLNGLSQLEIINGNLEITDCEELLTLEGLGNLQEVSGNLNVSRVNISNFKGLDNFERINGNLTVENNLALINFEGLSELKQLEHFYVENNKELVDFTGLGKLKTVTNFICAINPTLTNFNGLNSLENILGSFQVIANEYLTNFNGLSSLTKIGSLTIKHNHFLENLDGLNYVKTFEGSLRIEYNLALSNCSAIIICSYLANGGSAYISNNAYGCETEGAIIVFCESLSNVKGVCFYDENLNQIKDPNEFLYKNFSLNLSPENITLYPNPENGNAINFLAPGNYTISYNPNPYWELTSEAAYSFTIFYDTEEEEFYFGLYPAAFISEIETSINTSMSRCNEFSTFEISATNSGTTISDGTLWLEIDPDIAGGIYIDIPDVVESNRYGWHFENLYPGETIHKKIRLKFPDAEFTGETLHFESYAVYNDQNGEHTSRYFYYDRIVQCSYDPNDKLVNPARPGNYTLFEEDIIYTIRFQNTGNDVAYDVEIRDTLDPNLDITSFRLLSTSHGEFLTTTLAENRELTFLFTDIYLPDSTSNFEESQGYVTYLISPNEGLAEETPIHNSAGIYFDQNPPVLTNTTESLMVSMLPTTSTENIEKNEITIFPNPTSGKVVVAIEGDEAGELQLLDYTGKKLFEKNFISKTTFDLTHYPPGIYMINVKNENQVFSKKIIKI